jgi:3D (Asp-Asp-Asp) domain-containing protein
MTARIIGLATAVGLAAPASLGQVSTTWATTARFFVTGYVLRGYTATGTYVHPGTCAVDPRVIPLGSYITIAGLGTCHAEDTGGAILGYRIDVWVASVAQANALTGWYTASWGPSPTVHVPSSQASQPRSSSQASQPQSPGGVHRQRWYSHGSAYVHRDMRAPARTIIAQPSHVLTSKRAPHPQARLGRVLSQRWYSHGNAYVHRDTRVTARHSVAQPTYSLIKRH